MKGDRLALLATVPWRPVASFAGTAVAFLTVAAVWVSSPSGANALAWSLSALAAAAAYLLDEAAAEAVAATPTSLATRTLARAACAAALLSLGLAGIGVVALRGEGITAAGLSAQLVGCIAVALALAAYLRRRRAEPGELVAGAIAALIIVLGYANPFARWIDLFPRDAGPRSGGTVLFWATITLASAVLVIRAARDPLDGRRRGRTRGRLNV